MRGKQYQQQVTCFFSLSKATNMKHQKVDKHLLIDYINIAVKMIQISIPTIWSVTLLSSNRCH